MLEIIKLFVRRMLMGRGKGILQVAPKKDVDKFAKDLYKKFKDHGISDKAIRNPNDVKVIWNQITNREAQIVSTNMDDIIGGLRRTPLPKKSAEVLKFPSGGADKVPVTKQFTGQSFSADDHIKFIKSKPPIEAMKEANSVIGRKGRYRNITHEDADRILKDVDDHIFQRDVVPDEFDPDYASGGRIGYGKGKAVIEAVKAGLGKYTKSEVLIEMMKNTLKGSKDSYVKKNFPTFIKELTKNPDMAKNPNVWKFFTQELPGNQRLVVHSDDTVDFFTQTKFGPHNIEATTKFQKEHPFLSREQATNILNMEPEDRVLEMTRLEKLSRGQPHASGGIARVGYNPGGIVKGGKWVIKNLRRSYDELIEGKGKFSTIDSMQREDMKWELLALIRQLERGGKIPDEMLQTMRQDKIFKDMVKTPSTDPELRELEEVLLDTSSGKTLEQKQILEEFDITGRKKNESGGLAYMLGEPTYSDGGRIGFKDGTKFSPSKRKFLKSAGAGLGVLSMLPFVGKFFKPAAKLAKSKSVVSALETTNATGMPEHFTLLVNKVLKEGKIKDATKTSKTHIHPDRKDVEVMVERGGDEISVAFETDAGTKGNYLWKKGETIPPSKKGDKAIKTADEFMEGESGYWGRSGDPEPYKDTLEEIISGTDNLDDFVGITKIKKASGGRVPFVGGGDAEDYGELIDAYEAGINVMPGETLTDYINRIRKAEKRRKNKASGGLAHMLGEPTYAEGGRIGLQGGRQPGMEHAVNRAEREKITRDVQNLQRSMAERGGGDAQEYVREHNLNEAVANRQKFIGELLSKQRPPGISKMPIIPRIRQKGSPFEKMFALRAQYQKLQYPYEDEEDIPEGILELLKKDPNFDLEEFKKIGWSTPENVWYKGGQGLRGRYYGEGPKGIKVPIPSKGEPPGAKKRWSGEWIPGEKEWDPEGLEDITHTSYRTPSGGPTERVWDPEKLGDPTTRTFTPGYFDPLYEQISLQMNPFKKDDSMIANPNIPTSYTDESRMSNMDKARVALHEMRHKTFVENPELWKSQPEWVQDVEMPGTTENIQFTGGAHELYNRFLDQRYYPPMRDPGPAEPYFDQILKDLWEPSAKEYERIVPRYAKGGLAGLLGE